MRKAKFLHAGKLLLIALLIVSAVLLARSSGYYDRFFRSLPAADAESGSTEGTGLSAAELAAAVRPRTVLVRTREGVTAASAYAGEETEEAFHRFSAVLGEALGSADAPEEISEAEFRAGMERGCVFMDYSCPVPLEMLAACLGSDMSGEAAAAEPRFLCLGLTDTTAQLSYRDGGRFFRCATAAISETLQARMEEFQGTAACFAYEDRTLKHMEPYTVLLSELPQVSGVSGTALRDGVDTGKLMQTMGMNSFVASNYVEADGTRVFIDGVRTLRLSPDGTAVYRASAPGEEREIPEGLSAAVSYAYAAALRSIGESAGEADVIFSGVQRDGDDSYTVTFDYCIGSVPLRLPAGNAAEFAVKNGQIVSAQLTLRSYARTEMAELLLPMRQTAAVADAAGVTPALVYADAGEQISCVWVKD